MDQQKRFSCPECGAHSLVVNPTSVPVPEVERWFGDGWGVLTAKCEHVSEWAEAAAA